MLPWVETASKIDGRQRVNLGRRSECLHCANTPGLYQHNHPDRDLRVLAVAVIVVVPAVLLDLGVGVVQDGANHPRPDGGELLGGLLRGSAVGAARPDYDQDTVRHGPQNRGVRCGHQRRRGGSPPPRQIPARTRPRAAPVERSSWWQRLRPRIAPQGHPYGGRKDKPAVAEVETSGLLPYLLRNSMKYELRPCAPNRWRVRSAHSLTACAIRSGF